MDGAGRWTRRNGERDDPHRRTVRNGKFGRLWLFDYIAAGM